MLTREEAQKFIDSLIATYGTYGQTLSKDAAVIFAEDLTGFGIEPLLESLRKYRKFGSSFPPKISDLNKIIVGDYEAVAAERWAEVLRTARTVGSGVSVCFGDPLTHAVLERMGGWVFVAGQPEAQQAHNARAFSLAYRELTVNPPETYSRKLIGLEEMHNASFVGIKREPVRLIGRNWAEIRAAARVFYRGVGGADSLGELAANAVKYFPRENAESFRLQHRQKGIAALPTPKASAVDSAMADAMKAQEAECADGLSARERAMQKMRGLSDALVMNRPNELRQAERKAQAEKDAEAKRVVAAQVAEFDRNNENKRAQG